MNVINLVSLAGVYIPLLYENNNFLFLPFTAMFYYNVMQQKDIKNMIIMQIGFILQFLIGINWYIAFGYTFGMALCYAKILVLDKYNLYKKNKITKKENETNFLLNIVNRLENIEKSIAKLDSVTFFDYDDLCAEYIKQDYS